MSGTSSASRLVVACGLKAEARIAAGEGVLVLAGGGDSRALQAALEQAVPGARGLMSFGIAGGLAQGLKPGALFVASAVVGPDGRRMEVDAAWAEHLSARLCAPKAVFAGVDAPLAGPDEKSALHSRSGAVLVDMETHVAASVAAAHRLPFAALRAIADPAERRLPHAATVGMRPDGQVDIGAVLLSLARDPRQLPALIRTAFEARATFQGLLRGRQALGPGFGLLDLGEPFLDVP